jgi:hypothetical protein
MDHYFFHLPLNERFIVFLKQLLRLVNRMDHYQTDKFSRFAFRELILR